MTVEPPEPGARRRSPVAAKRAQREAIDRALALGSELTPTDLRVLLALMRLMTLYDRTEDRVANAQLQEATGILDDRRIRRSAKHLAELGVIDRDPGGGRRADGTRITTLYRFPITPGTSEPGYEEARAAEAQDPGHLSRDREGPAAPASEVLPEASSEVPGEPGWGSGNAADGIALVRRENPLLTTSVVS